MFASSLQAADPAPAKQSPLDRLKERSAAQRYQDSREQYFPESETRTKVAAPLPERVSLTESTKANSSSSSGSVADKNTEKQSQKSELQPAPMPQALDLPLSEFDAGRKESGETRLPRPTMVKTVPGPYFETTDPQTSNDATPLIDLPKYLESNPEVPPLVGIAQQSAMLPPAPIVEVAQLPIPDGGATPGDIDTVFRPISGIQPYFDYSPTGKTEYEYICPQPSSVPDDQRARCPEIQPLPPSGSTDRHFAMLDYQWYPTNLTHKPLYFEDVALERYGQRVPYGLQPFVSIGKFAVQGIGLPYQMAIDPVWRDIYPLGYYRPGDNAPELIYQVPFNLQAAAVAGGAYTGLIFLFP